jgi:hypothetical protein
MGEAKRRKKLDPNWAKSAGFSQTNKVTLVRVFPSL